MNPAVVARPAPVHGTDAATLYRRGFPVAAIEPHLDGVLAEALASPGSLTRLHLGLLAGEVLALPATVTRAFSTALEYFHTASLLLDDLPCMDDAAVRRHQACAHRRHGEAATILGALGFINRGYALFWQSLQNIAETPRNAAAAHVERCLGPSGVLGGQSLDLHFAESDGSPRAVARAALGKTVALLRLTFVTPALLAGAPARERHLLDRLSIYWGLAYQIADDCSDLQYSGATTGKTAGRDATRGRPNHLLAAGPDATAARLERLLHLVHATWAELVAVRAGWQGLGPLMVRLNQAVIAAAVSLEVARSSLRCA